MSCSSHYICHEPIELFASLISEVTDAVNDEVKAWQCRPLEPVYPRRSRRLSLLPRALISPLLSQIKEKVLAVVKLPENIGEAVKQIPDDKRNLYPQIPWKSVAGMRDIFVHQYWEIDTDVVRAPLQNSLPLLKRRQTHVKLAVDHRKRRQPHGYMQGKTKIAADFNAPLNDFVEYG